MESLLTQTAQHPSMYLGEQRTCQNFPVIFAGSYRCISIMYRCFGRCVICVTIFCWYMGIFIGVLVLCIDVLVDTQYEASFFTVLCQ